MHTRIVFILTSIILFSACSYTLKIKEGQIAYQKKYYPLAIELLQKEFNKSKLKQEKGKKAFLIGESYNAIESLENAKKWYKIASDNAYGTESMRQYAYILKKQEDYKGAVEIFKNLGIEIGSPYEFKKDILACNQAIVWLGKSSESAFNVNTTDFNTPVSEFSPFLHKDELIFSSDRISEKGPKYHWTGNNFFQYYTVKNPNIVNGSTIDKWKPELQTPFNQGSLTFNANGDLMILCRCGELIEGNQFCKLYSSEYLNNTWTSPEILPFIQENINYMHPYLSKDGKKLFFSANNADGWGGYDIYQSSKIKDDWIQPKLLNRTINTIGNELFPTLNNDTLYFASDGHQGMGGLDIFKTYTINGENWVPAMNMLPPINSGGDDFGIVVDDLPIKEKNIYQKGFFTSNRSGGKGSDDIYKFEKVVLPPKPIDTIKKEIKIYLNVNVLEKILSDTANPNSKVKGRKPLVADNIFKLGSKKESIATNKDNSIVELEVGKDYSFEANKNGYLTNVQSFSTKGIALENIDENLTFDLEIILDKVYLNREIRLENIYYDYDKADIRPDAMPTLDQLTMVLTQNPKINIQLSSHTDCRGNDVYNQELSQRRAQSAVDYLITKGINTNRLIAKGYGESSPEVKCICKDCTESEHQINRRTTFLIQN
jgi:peptidoglycan-associated lipoprotein